MNPELMTQLVVIAGLGQLLVLVAAFQVPSRLRWREELKRLSPMNRQMHWVYGGYVTMSIVAFALLSILNAREFTSGGALARGVAAYIAAFWGVRLVMQSVFDAGEFLSNWWLKAGYAALGLLFAGLTAVYGAVALGI
jgi:hypothetical protein